MRLQATIISAMLLVTGCINPRKVQRWNQEHPEEAARYCAENFPPVIGAPVITTRIDSAGYLQQLQDLQDLQTSLQALNEVNDSLIRHQIAQDTVCNKYIALLGIYQKSVQDLLTRSRTPVPVHHYYTEQIPVKDSAEAVALRKENTRLAGQLATTQKKLTEKEGQSKTRLWMFISACLLSVILLVMLFFKK